MLVLGLVLGACGAGRGAPGGARTTSTTTAPSRAELGREELSAGAAATSSLDPARRAELGLPPSGADVAATSLPPLSRAQWRDPEAVAARFVLVDTNYMAADDPRAVLARRSAYASERYAEELRESSSAAAGLTALAAQGAELHGDVRGVATVDRGDAVARVVVSVLQVITEPTGLSIRPRVAVYGLTLVPDDGGPWLVVDVELS